MDEHEEVEYNGNWLEINTHESKECFFVDVRITGRGPGPLVRQWAALELDPDLTFVDRESARNYGLRQAKSFVDKMIPRADLHLPGN